MKGAHGAPQNLQHVYYTCHRTILHLINELLTLEKWKRLDPLFQMGEIEIYWILYAKMFIMYINDKDECSKQTQIIYDWGSPVACVTLKFLVAPQDSKGFGLQWQSNVPPFLTFVLQICCAKCLRSLSSPTVYNV